MSLLERDDLIAAVQAARDSARDGRGACVLISGEAGAGKTALVRAAAPADAIWGFCESLTVPRPLGPFRDVAATVWQEAIEADPALLRERIVGWLRDAPAVMIVEDAHWIDEASADVLRFLARRIGLTSSLLVVTYRDEFGPDHPLRPVLGELVAAPAAIRLAVPPLSAAAVAGLIGTGRDADEVHRITGGNALLVSTLSQQDAPQRDHRLPSSLRDIVGARLAQLPTPGRAAVELLSVIPGRVALPLVADLLPDLDPAAIAGIITIDDDFCEFRHELVRLAVEDTLSAGRLHEVHLAVLGRLNTFDGAEPAAIAYHARHSHNLDIAYAAECSAAEMAAAAGTNRAAAEHYQQAIQIAPTRIGDAERARLWLALSKAERNLGRDAAALTAAETALTLIPVAADRLGHGAALTWLSRITTNETSSYELATEAVSLLSGTGPTVESSQALANLAMNRMVARDLGAAEHIATEAISLSERAGDDAGLVLGLQALGCALTLSGREAGIAFLRRAVDIANRLPIGVDSGRAWGNLVSATGEARMYAESERASVEATAYLAARDMDRPLAYAQAWRARCQFEQGHWDDAAQLADVVLTMPGSRSDVAVITAEVVASRVRVRRGGDAGPGLKRAERLAEDIGALQRLAPVWAARAEAGWLSGRTGEIAVGLSAVYTQAVDLNNHWTIGELGFWLWRFGLLTELAPGAAEPYRLHVAGRYEDAMASWLALGCRYEAADAGCDSSEPDTVRAALDLFVELGAQPGRHRAASRLRQLGVTEIPRGPRPTTAAHPDGLTGREQEVLALLRTGLTDAEIATRLHLSVRTVGHHVSAVLRKTGSRSRRDLRTVLS